MSKSSGPSDSPHDELPPPSYAETSLPQRSHTLNESAGHTQLEAQYAVPSTNEQQTVSEQQVEGPGAQPPPAYTDVYGTIDVSEGGMDTKAVLTDDGRISININQRSQRLSNILTPALHSQWKAIRKEQETSFGASYAIPEFARDVPPLNILIQIIGSRGDVQPFIALGKVLKEQYGHRVRVATHATFKGFVEEHGLEFFCLGGDPSELMAFMVKNPGLMPGMDSVKAGEVQQRRKGMWEMLLGGWRACIEPGDGMGYRPSVEPGAQGPAGIPFVADAIIANPPSFGHIHCAEKLGVPLHLMFTMPWSPTSAFPHPLANIQSSNVESSLTNFLSYALVDMMTWQGLGDLVNKFREGTLGLEAVSTMWAPGMISRLNVPHTYCWSPTLIPKPDDWPAQIHISGFYFLSLASSYTPPAELARFLAAGPPPIYIGFGSIVVDDPNALTQKIFKAVELAGCRALVSKGWGGIGADDLDVPENIMLLGNCPHDWLFPQCAAVVHHGGAGTTAAGIRCGKATVIVPFFGDQPFWGAMVSKAGAGEFIPHKDLTSENLAEAITKALSREVQAKAEAMGDSIRNETGAENGAMSFLASVEEMGLGRCDLLPDRVAVWKVKGFDIKLSALAANILVEANIIENGYAGLRLYRHKEWPMNAGPTNPISGGAGALLGTIGSVMMGVGDVPRDLYKGIAKKDKGKGVEGQCPTPESPSPASRSTESFATAGTGKNSEKASTPNISGAGTPMADTPNTPKGKGRGGGFDFEAAMGGSKAVSKIVGASIRSPMDFTLGIAQGFRNAPSLYGDEVRPESRVTGFQSGLKTAGKELGLGFYDGITGLVKQPYKGAKEAGPAGAIAGFGRGIAGLVLKPGAGIWGVPAYAMKGIHREYLKLFTKDVNGYIASARAAQGVHELLGAPPGMRRQVVERWAQLKSGKRQNHWRSWSRSGAAPTTNKKKLIDLRTYDDDRRDLEDEDLQRALRESASAAAAGPSTGYPHEKSAPFSSADYPPEKVAPPVCAPSSINHYDEESELQRAVQESLSPRANVAELEDPELMEALRRSLLAPEQPPVLAERAVTPPGDDDDDDDDSWENIGREESPNAHPHTQDSDPELAMALAESLRLEEERKRRLEEEDRVVMEYVARASREEEERRRRQFDA
ncbi:hypothetical protein FN846DRAFT_546447 [Sphaerosporella brunnea]|uniref:Uncharacterized protein n=1 Tax=Sphaerosporella brunnea TaxID=1250544 RepID=A0A5J5EEB9_9PEZI|nr:hypothetical protein FN846DRAFT_546447 [Sphaerosporella brunnea]